MRIGDYRIKLRPRFYVLCAFAFAGALGFALAPRPHATAIDAERPVHEELAPGLDRAHEAESTPAEPASPVRETIVTDETPPPETVTALPDQPQASEQKAAEQKAAEQKAAEQKAAEQKAAEQKRERELRPPDFIVEGAPAEPRHEMPLPKRARNLIVWVGALEAPPDARQIDWWLYQQSWIRAGAEFGWWRGSEALRLATKAAQLLQDRYAIGSGSENLNMEALARIEQLHREER